VRPFWQLTAGCRIDLLGFAILSNHFHLILRSRPDVVATWDDREVARRWLMLCLNRRSADSAAMPPTEPEVNSIANCRVKRGEIRKRLSNISWWMRLLCQCVAQRANHEEGETGRFFQDRYHLKEIYGSGELAPETTLRRTRGVQIEGNREVSRCGSCL